jgi:hypothetical protein
VRLAAFCEAPADFRMLAALVDRVLAELGPTWLREAPESVEVLRTWQSGGSGHSYFDVHDLNRYVSDLGIRGIRGRFDGQRGAGAQMARKAFLIVRALNEVAEDGEIEAAIIVWDMDHQASERAAGVESARKWARSWASFQIIYGLPDPEREAWVLAGFEPCDDDERACLDRLQRELELLPVAHAVKLRGPRGDLRDIKRVLRELTRDDPAREARCWTETPLATLRARGTDTGLASFLEKLEQRLVPLLAGDSSR